MKKRWGAMKQKTERWACFLLVIFAPVFCMLWKMQNAFISDTDLFWHIKLGKHILQTKTILGDNGLSWITQEEKIPFINHSWATDIILYLLSCINGYMVGALIFNITTMAVLAAVLYIFWQDYRKPRPFESNRNILTSFIMFSITTWAIYETRGNPRPQQLSLIFYLVAWKLLEILGKQGSKKAAAGLVILSIVWANFHGGTIPILFVQTALWLIFSLIPSFDIGQIYHNERYHGKLLGVTLIAEIIAGCVNPYGLWLYTQLYKVSETCAVINVSEWQPASIENAAWVFVSAAIFILILVIAPRQFEFEEIAFVIAFWGMTILRVRAYPWYALALAIVVLKHREDFAWAVSKISSKIASTTQIDEKTKSEIALTSFLAGCIALTACIGMAVQISATSYYRLFPKELVTTLQTINPKRLYTSYNSGGMAIEAGFQSFVDSRADAFTPEILADATILSSGSRASETKINDVLSQYQFDAILLARYDNLAIISYFDQREDWTCIYSDEWYALYMPTTGATQLAAEYMSLNGASEADGTLYVPVYLDADMDIEYVAPQDVLALLNNHEKSFVFFTDARNDDCRTKIVPALEYAETNGYDKLYVCNIEQYKMKYGYDTTGELVITQNRTEGYDELLTQLDAILPAYTVTKEDGSTTTLDVKTVPAPFAVCIQNGQATSINI